MSTLRAILAPMAIFGSTLFALGATASGDDTPELTKENGPFMVLAYSFRGPESDLLARTLAKELKKDHDLPSFVFRGLGKNEPPQACVLVGNCKNPREAAELRDRVKKLEPKCLVKTTGFFTRWKGLSRAMITINPLVDSGQFSCTLGRKNPADPDVPRNR